MFVHLRLHSEFSVVDGTNRIDDAVQVAADDKQPALALTDLNNLFGTIKFYKQARSKGVKPLLGAEIYLESLTQDANHLSKMILLVQSQQGYLNLCELLSRGWTQNVHKAVGVIKLAWLQELSQGLIALSGAQSGPVGQALVQGDLSRASELALQIASIFPHRFYIELQRAGRTDDEAHVVAAVQLASNLNLPVVATHPVQFTKPDDYEAHEARVCISEGEILGNQRRVRKFTREQYFKSSAQMVGLFADIPSAVANTLEIAKRLSTHPLVSRVRYPGLPTDSEHEKAKAFMKGFGAIVSFEFAGTGAQADKVCESSKIVTYATSLGGVESLWERRRRWPIESPSVPESLIRLSVGIENVDDLWADIDAALHAAK